MICTNMTMTTYDNGTATTIPCGIGRGGTATVWYDYPSGSEITAKSINLALKKWTRAYDEGTTTPCTYTFTPISASSSAICTSFYKYGDWGPFADGVWGDCCSHWSDAQPVVPLTPKQRMMDILQSRHAPVILGARKSLVVPQDIREIRARETLQRVIGNDKFQKFLKDGFISVRAKSGLSYQIFPAHGITNVYCDGEQIERLCVVLRGDFPPTDSLIMRYLIILNDETRFRSYAIKHTVIVKKPKIVLSDDRSLTEIFQEMKQARKVA